MLHVYGIRFVPEKESRKAFQMQKKNFFLRNRAKPRKKKKKKNQEKNLQTKAKT